MDTISEHSDELGINNNSIEWTPEHELILIEWADKAMCYRWLHGKANTMFSALNAWYTIPVIVISTLTGTANFAQERVPLEYQTYFVMLVGGDGDFFADEVFDLGFFAIGADDLGGGREGDGLFADFEFFLLLVVGGEFAGDRDLDAAAGVGGADHGERDGKS